MKILLATLGSRGDMEPLKKCIFGFRSEHAKVDRSKDKNSTKTKLGQITGTVEGVENMGEEMILAVQPSFITKKTSSEDFLMLKSKGFSGFQLSDNVVITFTGKGYLFNPNTKVTVSGGETKI